MTYLRLATTIPFVIAICYAEPAASDSVRSLLVEVRCGQNIGGGLVFGLDKDRIYMVTPHHVIRDCIPAQVVQVFFHSRLGRPIQANIHDDGDTNLDLAVISTPASVSPTAYDFGFEALGKVNSIVQKSVVHVYSHGSGRLWMMSYADDRVVSRQGNMITFQSSSVSAGSSGGALLDKDYLLVGMITVDDNHAATAISISAIVSRLRDWGYDVALREPLSPPSKPIGPSGTAETARVPKHQTVMEEHFSNTVFQLPLGWVRRPAQDSQPLMLVSTDDYFRETEPQYWIEIAPSARLNGDFHAAFDASLNVPGYRLVLGPKGSLASERGFTQLFIKGEMRNERERIFFLQVSANPGDRYEEIVFCSRVQTYFEQFLPLFLDFMDKVDYQTARAARALR